MQINPHKAISQIKSVDRQLSEILKPSGASAGDGDTVEIGGGKRTYSSGYVQLSQELSDQLLSLTGLVGESAGQQKDLAGLFGDVKSEEAVRARAQELLDGYFNVENTGDRIFDFAFSHYKGGDREAFAREMQGHIHKGFDEAEKALGGLADISVDTRSYIDQRVEDFIKGDEETAEDTGETEDGLETPTPKLDPRAFVPEV